MFRQFVLKLPDGIDEIEITSNSKQWAENTHRYILNKSNEMPNCGMGSILRLLFLGNGSSIEYRETARIYRYRSGILRQLTTDHSINQLTGDRSHASNQIYNSLGGGDSIFIDIKNLSGQILEEDIYLICSDGLYDMLTDDEIERIVTEDQSVDALINAAKNAGGKDNVSVILLEIIY